MFCSNCGAEATGKFCSRCGQPLSAANPKPVNDTKEWAPTAQPGQSQTAIEPEAIKDPTNTEDIRFAKVDESIKRRSQSSVAHLERSFQKSDSNAQKQSAEDIVTPEGRSQKSAPSQDVNRVNKTVVKNQKGSSGGTASGKDKSKTKHKTKVKQPSRFSISGLLGSGIANILRYLSLACMGVLTLYTAAGFWSERNALGDIVTIREASNYAMYIYVGLGLFFVAFGGISCLWIFSRRRMADGRRMRRYDTGRGLVSFLLFALVSYFAAAIIVQIPSSPDYLRGVSAALQVFFVHKTLNLTFCIGGIICCVLRGVKFH